MYKACFLIIIGAWIVAGCQSDPAPDPAATKLVPEAKNGGKVPSPGGQFNQTSDKN